MSRTKFTAVGFAYLKHVKMAQKSLNGAVT